MQINNRLNKITGNILLSVLLLLVALSCNTSGKTEAEMIQKINIKSPELYTIINPVAGVYPQSLFKYPYKHKTTKKEAFTQTLDWLPAVTKTFNVNTQYTAVITLAPADNQYTLKETKAENIKNLPEKNVENISTEVSGDNLIIKILYEKTADSKSEPELLFFDEFNSNELDSTKWALCPEWDRQGRSSWRDDMVSVSGGYLHLKIVSDPVLGAQKSTNKNIADNWIRAGSVRTRTRTDWAALFDNTYGYYEARIKFPPVRGTWGAFWLMSTTQDILTDRGVIGTEIDIIETIGNESGRYNAALHWDGYNTSHKSINSENLYSKGNGIYDGQFHVFALDWSPAEYVFYVDGIEFWRVDGGPAFLNCGINRNPNYIKLSVEGADWAGRLPDGFTEAEMLVDYVRVYNQKPY